MFQLFASFAQLFVVAVDHVCSGHARASATRCHTRSGPGVQCAPSRIRCAARWHFAKFFLEVESNFERVNLDSSTSVLLSFVHTAALNADSPQHRTAGWRFIDWNEVEQRELLAEAKRLLETGELFPRGTAEEPHAPDAEGEASDSEPEAHVMVPLADDHSSDSDDAPNGVEESAAPAAPAVAAAPKRAAMSLLERLQAIRIIYGSKPPT